MLSRLLSNATDFVCEQISLGKHNSKLNSQNTTKSNTEAKRKAKQDSTFFFTTLLTTSRAFFSNKQSPNKCIELNGKLFFNSNKLTVNAVMLIRYLQILASSECARIQITHTTVNCNTNSLQCTCYCFSVYFTVRLSFDMLCTPSCGDPRKY